MNILGFDTCFESCSVAVGRGLGTPGAVIVQRNEPMATGQAERLMPMIAAAMDEAGLAFGDLDRIAVTHGPGTFTGMRIGVAAARALALSLEIPVVSLTSLEVMAESPALGPVRSRGTPVVIAVDARRGQVYAQHFGPGGQVSEPRIMVVAEAAGAAVAGKMAAAGSGAPLMAKAARPAGHDIVALLPDLRPIMADALTLAMARSPVAAPPRPLYLRPPDAKPQEGKSLARL